MSSELTKRILTSIVLVAIVLNCLFISNYAWLVLLIVVSIISWFEFFNLTIKIYKNFFLKLIFSLLNFSLLFLFAYSAYKVRNESGELIILFIMLVCIFSDIGGYVVGKNVGGKKLTKISPNKTISGSIGSFLFSLFPIGIYALIANATNNVSFKFALEKEVIVGCLIISLISQLGDLIISYFKRLAKVKDTGNILPGHGGILDRIDGIIFTIIIIPFLDKIIFWVI
ncbi:MAG: phosphatidate cytidylyltransferase [Pelagibacterales bacterium]|nr:phosphatidate cytidylyltransferase [Pelagibacterales bacterium]